MLLWAPFRTKLSGRFHTVEYSMTIIFAWKNKLPAFLLHLRGTLIEYSASFLIESVLSFSTLAIIQVKETEIYLTISD